MHKRSLPRPSATCGLSSGYARGAGGAPKSHHDSPLLADSSRIWRCRSGCRSRLCEWWKRASWRVWRIEFRWFDVGWKHEWVGGNDVGKQFDELGRLDVRRVLDELLKLVVRRQ